MGELSTIAVGGVALGLDTSGAVCWPARRTLVVADLHFEKGSAFAEKGSLLPPYDTRATLTRLADLLERFDPARVIALGDSFHDERAGDRMSGPDAERLRMLAAARDWIWIAGNHDPRPPPGFDGAVVDDVVEDGLVFRHEPERFGPHASPSADSTGEIFGHFHPKALVTAQGKRVWRACFVEDGRRLALPAFGAYAGGLDIAEPDFARLYPAGFTAHLLGRGRLFSFASSSAALA